MTDFSVYRGDSKTIQVTITDSVTSNPIDLTEAILRFAVKRRTDLSNDDAEIFKTSYDASEIEITDAVNGVCVIKLEPADNDLPLGSYCWDLELTRKGSFSTSTGTFDVTTGSNVLDADGAVDFSKFEIAYVIETTGAGPGNTARLVITSIDTVNRTITTDNYDQFTTETGLTHSTFIGNRKTVASGQYTVTKNATT